MLIIIYTKGPQKLEDWAQRNRTPEKLYHIRDVRGFKPADIEPCDEVWMTEEYPVLRKGYRNVKLFNPTEEKQRQSAPKAVRSRRTTKPKVRHGANS